MVSVHLNCKRCHLQRLHFSSMKLHSWWSRTKAYPDTASSLHLQAHFSKIVRIGVDAVSRRFPSMWSVLRVEDGKKPIMWSTRQAGWWSCLFYSPSLLTSVIRTSRLSLIQHLIGLGRSSICLRCCQGRLGKGFEKWQELLDDRRGRGHLVILPKTADNAFRWKTRRDT